MAFTARLSEHLNLKYGSSPSKVVHVFINLSMCLMAYGKIEITTVVTVDMKMFMTSKLSLLHCLAPEGSSFVLVF